MRDILPGLLAIATVCSLGSAQAPSRIDAGTLTITSNTPMGTRISTEEFTIVQNADGGFTMNIIVTGGRQMRSVLTTDSVGNPTAYEHNGRGGEAVERRDVWLDSQKRLLKVSLGTNLVAVRTTLPK